MGVLTKLSKMIFFFVGATLVAASPITAPTDAVVTKPNCTEACKNLDAACQFFGLDPDTCHLSKCGRPRCLSCMGDCPPHGGPTTYDLVTALDHIEKPKSGCFFVCNAYDGCTYKCNVDDAAVQAATANGSLIIDSKDVSSTFEVASKRPSPSCYQCNPFLGTCYIVPQCRLSGDAANTQAVDNCRRICNHDGSVCAMMCRSILDQVPAKRDPAGICHEQCDDEKCWIVCPPLAEE